MKGNSVPDISFRKFMEAVFQEQEAREPGLEEDFWRKGGVGVVTSIRLVAFNKALQGKWFIFQAPSQKVDWTGLFLPL